MISDVFFLLYTYTDEDDFYTTYSCVSPLCSKWFQLSLALGLPPSLLSFIEKDQPDDMQACFRSSLLNWLQRNYNIEKHGLPTWRRLVEAVDSELGGNDQALASKIAKEHKSQ